MKKYQPLTFCEKYSAKYKELGEEALLKNEAAVLLLAGGEGSRLGFNGPKGAFPLDGKNLSLFEVLAKKLLLKQKKYNQPFILVVMVSEKNEQATISFFEKNQYFGLSKENIYFFTQPSLPYLDEKGDPVKDEQGGFIQGPGGNGAFFEEIKKQKVLEKLFSKKIKYLQVIPVDNPLAEPLDPVFLGFHLQKQNDVSLIALKASEKAKEKMGALALDEGFLKVVEYIYFSEEDSFSYLNSGLFLFSLDFILKHQFQLPVHKVLKKIKINPTLSQKAGLELYAYKTETFIFDCLSYTQKASAIVYPKSSCFAPLKDRKNIKEVKKNLFKDRLFLSVE